MAQRAFEVIAHIESDFDEKFGIPRQSGLAQAVTARVVFEPAYRVADALRGLSGYSHIWLLWEFSEAIQESWSPTVRPPRLGGNTRMGVFATRSPYRPNPIGLSCVQLLGIEQHPQLGGILCVGGADLLNGTPIYDIKPYIAYTDSRPQAVGGFADTSAAYLLQVDFPEQLQKRLPPDKREAAVQVLSYDPRPSYHSDPERIYGMHFAGRDIRFTVREETLTVLDVR